MRMAGVAALANSRPSNLTGLDDPRTSSSPSSPGSCGSGRSPFLQKPVGMASRAGKQKILSRISPPDIVKGEKENSSRRSVLLWAREESIANYPKQEIA